MTTSDARSLSELEGVCLGIICKHQPCTAYQVRNELRKAPSSHWRASAGSVYPLLSRLEQEGLISTTCDEDDGRGRKHLRVVPRGKAALKRWLLAGIDQQLISSVTDPLRSRTFFLGLLSAARRRTFLDKLVVAVEVYLAETRAHLAAVATNGDDFEYLGALGAVQLTAARLEWLREVRRRLTAASGTPR